MEDRIQDGLEILRREARGSRGKRRSWKHHEKLMKQAAQHVRFCGGVWEDYAASFKKEIAELMRL